MTAPVVVTDPADGEAYAAPWRDLVADAPWSSYFMTPDWQLAWWEVMGRGRRGRLAVWPSERGVDAVVGLVRERLHPRLPLAPGPWAAMGSGPGAADHLGWVVRPHRRDAVREWIASQVGRATLLLPDSDPDSGTGGLVPGAAAVATTRCPRVALAEPVPPGSSRLRKGLRHDERRLADDGVTFDWLAPGAVSAEVLDELLRLHGTRADERGWATSFTADRRRFHVALLGRARPGCGPAAVVARQGDEVVGVLYGFVWRSTFAYYQTGWDPGFARRGLGTVLVATAMRAASDAGCDLFDFLRGPEPYKYRFGATDRVDTTWLRPRGLVGRWTASRHQAPTPPEPASEEDAGARALRH